ncbi:MAG: sulfite oxidase heme-binding subunit YedZ [Gammaproteobacteria bacterium]
MTKAVKWVVFVLGLLPLAALLLGVFTNTLGPDPADTLAAETGEWTFRFLLLSLAITPLRNIGGWPKVFPYRRTFGLFALFYASLHFLVYLVFLLQLRWSEIFEDIVERPYITVGFSAFILLMVLGVTSTKRMMRKLGRRWRQLHKLVYLINVLALIHLVWILRTDLAEAVIYGSILLPLLAYRVYRVYACSASKHINLSTFN